VLSIDGERVARFGPVYSEYPHHAAWSGDGTFACFNSCHFYNGVTVGAQLDQLRGLELDAYDEDERLRPIQGGMRVYASEWMDDAFALGDAGGYVRAVTPSGEEKWRHFVGSSIGGIARSPDGRMLAVATAAGFLSLLDTRPDAPDPAVIGTAGFAERLRYVTWRGESVWRW
jgi:hypothetical protein